MLTLDLPDSRLTSGHRSPQSVQPDQPGDSAGPEGLDRLLCDGPVSLQLLQQEKQLHPAALHADRR